MKQNVIWPVNPGYISPPERFLPGQETTEDLQEVKQDTQFVLKHGLYAPNTQDEYEVFFALRKAYALSVEAMPK